MQQQRPASVADRQLQEIRVILKEMALSRKHSEEERKKSEAERKKWEEERKEYERQAKREYIELRRSQQETAERLKETAAQLKQTDKQLKKTDARFNSQWGRLVESLVKGKLVKLLRARGIDVHSVTERQEVFFKDEKGVTCQRELDILVSNKTDIAVVEVKTSLFPDDVKYFLETLKMFKKICPRYERDNVYGAVAYLRSESKAALYAERQGLFVIRATGDSASLVNDKAFQPRSF